MFGLGFWEVVVIAVVALLVLGPEKLPGLARQAGRVTRELRRVMGEFQANLHSADVELREQQRPPPAPSTRPTPLPSATPSPAQPGSEPTTPTAPTPDPPPRSP